MDTGVGSSLYSFIEQGRVDSIVNAAPLDRRSLIDEAAGISGYKSRRAESLQRLQATGVQLDRAADVADEMGRRLRVVRQQVKRAAHFRRLRALIRQREIALALIKYAALTADRRALREGTTVNENRVKRLQLNEQQQQEDLEASEKELQLVVASLSEWRDQVAECDARLREIQATMGFVRQQEGRLAERAEERVVEEAALETERSELDRLEMEAKSELTSARERQAKLTEANKSNLAVQNELRERRARAQHEAGEAGQRVHALEAKLAGLRAVYEQRLKQQADLPRRQAELQHKQAQLQLDVAKLEETVKGVEDQTREAIEASSSLESRKAEETLVEQLAREAYGARQADAQALDETYRLRQAETESQASTLMASIERRMGEIDERVRVAEAEGQKTLDDLARETQQQLVDRRAQHEERIVSGRKQMERTLETLARQLQSELRKCDESWQERLAQAERSAEQAHSQAAAMQGKILAEKESTLRKKLRNRAPGGGAVGRGTTCGLPSRRTTQNGDHQRA